MMASSSNEIIFLKEQITVENPLAVIDLTADEHEDTDGADDSDSDTLSLR